MALANSRRPYKKDIFLGFKKSTGYNLSYSRFMDIVGLKLKSKVSKVFSGAKPDLVSRYENCFASLHSTSSCKSLSRKSENDHFYSTAWSNRNCRPSNMPESFKRISLGLRIARSAILALLCLCAIGRRSHKPEGNLGLCIDL